jgi:membrane-anchored glycerophosphoryl diester phosphodiesterase (GDPDase)
VIAAPFIVWVSMRLITLWPLLIDRNPGAMAAIRESFRLTGGHGLKIAGVVLLAGSAYLLATGVAQIAGGSVFLLLGRAIGDAAVGRLLTDIVVAAVAGLLATVWSVFVALLYRRLAGSSNGI